MKEQLRHEVEIAAGPAAVWAVLTDTDAYPEWNPFILELAGELQQGARLKVRIAPPGGRAVTLRPTLLAVRPERELRWRGRLFIRGLFDGEHRFELEELAHGRTRLIQSEQFSGVLVRFVRGLLTKTAQGFAAMDHALKARAESRQPAVDGQPGQAGGGSSSNITSPT